MEFELQNRHDEKIVGIIEEPGHDKLAIVMHGLSGTTEQEHIKVLRQSFLDSGYSVLAFDCTHSFGKSGGTYETVTLSSYLEDLEDVVDYAKKQTWFRSPFALAGHSMGGYTVARFAELFPEECSLIIPFAPVVSGQMLEQTRREKDQEGYEEWQKTGIMEEVSSSRPELIKRLRWHPHVTDSRKHDLLPSADKLTMPTLIIVGENDQPCPIWAQEKLLAAIPSENKSLKIIPGAPHTFVEEGHLDQLSETIKDWLKEQ